MLMNRGELTRTFAERFDAARPTILLVGRGKRAYLWIGGVGGPCYATLSEIKSLRRLATSILRAVGDAPK